MISVYSMYSLKLKKIKHSALAQVEHTRINGDFVESKTLVKSNYTTLLPNIQFTNKVNTTTT